VCDGGNACPIEFTRIGLVSQLSNVVSQHSNLSGPLKYHMQIDCVMEFIITVVEDYTN
jgi:hypothetical protein